MEPQRIYLNSDLPISLRAYRTSPINEQEIQKQVNEMLDMRARIVAGEKVLITSAAGGVGHIAVQWAKAAECHVIGTCSSEEKEQVLKELGCDRIINYKQEDVAGVLAKEYEGGVDVVWETIGGEMLETCLANLAQNGRIVIVGGISSYKNANAVSSKMDVPSIVLAKAASLLGFRRGSYRECFSTYFKHLTQHFQEGKLKTIIDNGEKSTGNEFFGMEGIIRGVEYLQSGKSIGKVVARLH
ncbi:hypothetical protein JTE90_024199 [Oedothorax gibbosus]|uniref:15-oxoprostaglandin 13-reductase n=1 Tax=Oedothorax gibbosus TaxID=931172 RepID=A0AAV6U0P0_9ARAC|nr:hypothetical protein JTE90_024199 [Oedothorax gibbosus]